MRWRYNRTNVRTERSSKITVIVRNTHVADLDRLAIDLRMHTRQAFSRAELIGAITEAAIRRGMTAGEAFTLIRRADTSRNRRA